MEGYVGKYRVDIERDLDTGDPIKNGFTYLRCVARNKDGKVYRYDEDTLVCYMKGIGKINNTCKQMDKLGLWYKMVLYDEEGDIHFKEDDLDKLHDLIGLTSFGAKIPPQSIKNHPRKDEIKQERLDNMSDEEKEAMRLKGERLQSILNSKKETTYSELD